MSLNLSPPNTLARQHQQQQPQHQPQHPHRYNYTTYPQQQPQQQNLPAFYPQLQQQLQQHLQQQLEKLPFDGSNTNSSDLAGLDLPEFGADLDLDFDLDLDSLSSSPASTQSLVSRFPSLVSSPLTALDGLPTPVLAEPSLFAPSQQSTRALVAASDAMQTETWMPSGGQVTPRSVGPFSHHRESSRSSMGSNGPMSPFPNNLITPQIAANDSAGDSFHGLPNSEDLGNYQLAAKAFPSVTNDGFYAIHTGYAPAHGPATTSSMANYPYVATAPRRTDAGRALLVPSEHPIGPGRSQPVSHPVSVASSIAPDSPATPAGEPEEDRKRSMARVPRLDRTTTDAYADELYSPDFTNLASSSSGQASISPTSDLFTQRIQAANQHLSAVSNSPVSATSRDRSPFCQGSPLAPLPMHDFPATAMGPSQVRFGSAQQLREQNKAALDAQAMAHQHMSRSVATSTPQTISPRDAMLDYHEPDGDANFPPLFPPSNNNGFNPDVGQKAAQAQQAYGALSLDNNGFNNFMGTTSMPTSMQMAQPYLFGVQRPQSAVPSASNMSVATTRLGSADTGLTDSVHGTPQRPLDTRADGGTYTCTYHGCTLRFDTPALLQKHKREGHRHPHGLGSGTRRPEGAVTLLNTQAGPHRCDRINPSTGKACNTIFSRPYDLTRHEDTIHNARKQKVRCDLCTDEKTFSRADALTRHYRVCHPDVEFPGKQRRRGAHSG